MHFYFNLLDLIKSHSKISGLQIATTASKSHWNLEDCPKE